MPNRKLSVGAVGCSLFVMAACAVLATCRPARADLPLIGPGGVAVLPEPQPLFVVYFKGHEVGLRLVGDGNEFAGAAFGPAAGLMEARWAPGVLFPADGPYPARIRDVLNIKYTAAGDAKVTQYWDCVCPEVTPMGGVWEYTMDDGNNRNVVARLKVIPAGK